MIKLLSTNRDTLLKPLNITSGFVEKKQTMPILSNVYVKKSGHELTVIANDMEIQVCVTNNEEMSGEDFIITIPGKKLQDILKAIPDNAKITLTQDDNKILVTSGKLKYTIQSLPAEHYPLLKISDSIVCEFTLEQIQLKQMLWQIQYAMADKDSRVFLNGMLFEIKNNQLRLVATDAHRLGFSSIDLTNKIDRDISVIIPRKTVTELFKILDGTTEPIQIKFYTNQVFFETNGKQLITKIIDGKYPDYERVIPMGNDKLCIVNRTNLLNAVERVAVIGSDKIKNLTLELSPNLLTLSCQNDEQENSHDEIDIVYENSTPIKISFNLNYLRDLLSNNSAEVLQLGFFDGQRSVLATIPANTHFKAVVMPMRV
ncbi:MAG: DNA polymerase III subunit beta [Burkholderiales bacterium]|nr:DNA polymerase III subunit beta [Burkholderiales bacterium]